LNLKGSKKIKEQNAFALCDTALVYCVLSQSKLLIETRIVMNWCDFKRLHIIILCAVWSASERCKQLNKINKNTTIVLLSEYRDLKWNALKQTQRILVQFYFCSEIIFIRNFQIHPATSRMCTVWVRYAYAVSVPMWTICIPNEWEKCMACHLEIDSENLLIWIVFANIFLTDSKHAPTAEFPWKLKKNQIFWQWEIEPNFFTNFISISRTDIGTHNPIWLLGNWAILKLDHWKF
jgi:hypothetical protein